MKRGSKPTKPKRTASPGKGRHSGNDTPARRPRDLRTRLADALAQQAATSEILGIIRRSPGDAQPVFAMMAERAMRLCGGLHAGVLTFDGALVHLAAHVHVNAEFADALSRFYPRRPDRGGVAARAILTRATVHIPDIEKDPEYEFGPVAQQAGFRSALGVPMLRDGQPIGAIAVFGGEATPFSDAQIELLRTFADQAVIAIENVRLFTELEARNRTVTQAHAEVSEALEQQTATSEILRVISTSPTDLQPVFDAIAERAMHLCGASSSGVLRFDGELVHIVALGNVTPEGAAALRSAFPMPPNRQSASTRAILTRDVVHIPDIFDDRDYGIAPRAQAGGFRSVLSVPMLREGSAIGSITVGRPAPGRFSERHVKLLQTFADQAVIAIENVRLFRQLDDRNRDLRVALEQQTATSELLKVIGRSTFDLQPVFETLAENAGRLCAADRTFAYRFDGVVLRVVAAHNVTAELRDFTEQNPIAPGRQGGAARAALERRTIHIPDVHADPEYRWPARQIEPVRTVLAVPIVRSDDELLGVIVIYRHEVLPFTGSQVALVETFADQAAIAIENERLLNQLQTKNAHLTESLAQQTATSELLRVIGQSTVDLQPVFETLFDNAVRLCEAERALVFRFDGQVLRLAAARNASADVWTYLEQHPIVPGRHSASARAAAERRTIHIPDVLADPENSFGVTQVDPFRTVLALPVLWSGELLGTILIYRHEVRPFTESQIALMENFTDQAAIAIENARLLGDLQTKNATLTEALAQQTATSEVLELISRSAFDLQPVFDTIVESVVRLCDGLSAFVYRFDGELIHVAAHHRSVTSGTLEAFLKFYPAPPSRASMISRAILERTIVHVRDFDTDPDVSPASRQMALAAGHKSTVAVPMLRDGVPIGAVAVGRRDRQGRARPFSDREIELLKTFADQAVIAIENVRLFKELEARNRDLGESLERQTATGEILRVISSSPTDVQPVLDAMAENAARLCDAEDVSILERRDGSIHVAVFRGASELRDFDGAPVTRGSVGGRAIIDGRLVHVYDIREESEAEFPVSKAITRELGHRTMLAVPLLREGTPIGAIFVRRTEVRPFTEKQIELLQTFADQAVIAIENVRLFKELEARNAALTEALDQQTATSDILRVISGSPMDVQPVFDAIVESAVRLCDGVYGFVGRFDGQQIHFAAHYNYTPEALEISQRMYPMVPSRQQMSGRVILTGAVVQIEDLWEDREYRQDLARAGGWRSSIGVPLMREGRAIGVITVMREQPGAFSSAQTELLKTFADQAVIAIENVRLFRELEDRNRELNVSLEQQTATSEILAVIPRSPTDAQPVFDTIARSAARLCEAFDVAIYRREEERLRLVAHHGPIPLHGALPLVRGIVNGRAVLDGRTLHIADMQTETAEFPQSSENARRMGHRTVLSVPLMREGGMAIGTIQLRRTEARPFSDRQVALLQTFADQAVIAIENVRLFTELQEKNEALIQAHAQVSAALEQQTATSEILKVISSSPTDVQPVFDAIVASATRLCQADLSGLYRFDGTLIHFVAEHGRTPEEVEAARRAFPQPLGRASVSARAILDAAIVQVPDVRADVEMAGALRSLFRTVMAVPMLRDGRPIGTITVARRVVRSFSDKEIALLQTFADQAVIAIENVRLFQELEARNRDLTETLEQQTATGEILRVISRSTTDAQPVFDTIARNAARLCEAQRCFVFRFDGALLHLSAVDGSMTAEGREAFEREWPRPASRGTAGGRAVLDRDVAHIPDVHADPDYQLRPVAAVATYGSTVAVPMLRDGVPIGTINLNRARTGPFSARQIELLKTFADQAVIAVENVRLFQDLEARNRELRVALEQQTATSELLKVIGRSAVDLEPVFETLVENAMRLCEAERGVVLRFDGQVLRFAVGRNMSPAFRQYFEEHPIALGRETNAGRAALERRTVHNHDVLRDPEYRFGGLDIEPYRTVLGVPMLRADELLGVVLIYRHEVRPFTESHISLVETFADQAAIAIENARLLSELQTKNADLTESLEQQTATSEILRVISRSATDAQPVFETIAEHAWRLCDADVSGVLRFDGELVHVAALGKVSFDSPIARAFPMPPSKRSAAARAILTGEVVHIPDGYEDPEYRLSTQAAASGFRSALAVPMRREGSVIGSIVVGRTEPGPFSDRHLELLKTFADQAVIAIENVRLFQDLEARNRDLRVSLEQQTATSELLKVIGRSTFDLQPVFQTLVDNAVRLCEAERGAILRFDGQILRLVVGLNMSPKLKDYLERNPIVPGRNTITGRTAIERRTVHIHDVARDPEYNYGGSQLDPYRTMLGIPMLRADELLGVIVIYRHDVRPFSDGHIALMETFADQAAIAIENARLLTELQTKNASLTEALEQQTATADILRVISTSPTDIQPVLETVAKSAARFCAADDSEIFTLDGDRLKAAVHHGPIPSPIGRGIPVVRGSVSGRAVIERHPVHVADLQAEVDEFPLGSGLAREFGYRTTLAVPLLREGAAVGTINLRRTRLDPFTDKQVALLQTFADQAVIAIANVRLFTELEARNRELRVALEQQTATSELLKVIGRSTFDLAPVFQTLAENGVRLCEAERAFIFRFDGHLLHAVASHNASPELQEFVAQNPIAPGRYSSTARTALERRTIHIHDAMTDPEYTYGARQVDPVRTVLTVPMIRADELLGVITIYRLEVRPFTENQIALVETFADQAAIAIENARLLTELQTKNADLTESLEQQTATSEILGVISSSPTDVHPVFDTIARNARALCAAETAGVFMYDGGRVTLEALDNTSPDQADALRAAYPMEATGGHATGRAILTGRPAHIADVREDPDYALHGLRDSTGLRSLLSVPMLRDGTAIGAITVQRWGTPRPFSDKQTALLETFADQAVIAIQNVRLFKELEIRNRELTETLEQQTATSDVLKLISRSTFDLEPVLQTLIENATRLCRAEAGVIYRFDGELQRLAATYNIEPEFRVFMEENPIGPDQGTAVGRALIERRTIHIHDVLADRTYTYPGREFGGYRTILGVPMLREGVPIGVFTVWRTDVRPFTEKQIELVTTFADQGAIAIENVRLFQELEARTEDLTRSVGELQALGEVSQAVSSTLDLDTVLATIVSHAVQLSGCDQGIVYDFDEASETFHARATHQVAAHDLETLRAATIRLGQGAIGRAGVLRRPVQLSDIEAEGDVFVPQVRELLTQRAMRSLLAVPFIRDERLLGGLVVVRRARGAFSDESVATLQTFATQSVLAMHNAGLFREIQRQKQYSEALVETSPVAIVTVDLRGGVVGWNPAAERLFGYTPAEALGRRIDELVATAELLEEVQASLAANVRGERVRTIAQRARKDGSLIDVEISTMPVIVDGAQVGSIGIYHDITELLQARREAEAANEAKSAFLATMSHEIRTPMNAVIGMSGLLLNTALTDEQREYAEVVRQSGDALLTVINDILDFSKIEAGKLELESQPFDLRDCLESALDLVATRAAEKGLDLAYLVGDGTPAAIVGDVTRLRQILLNLLSNAVKFTETGEVVLSVTGRRVDDDPDVHELAFSVRDTGIGIPADRVDRLFQSFSQVDASTTRRYGGTGLGLAISRRLAELMGGDITVTSEVGRGSDFRVTIRARLAEASVVARRDLSGVQPSLRGKYILVVDDNATNRRIVTANLDAWGIQARATGSPTEALSWIEGGERFDVGILDMHMPEMDGVALARALRRQVAGQALPLILFTSLGRREARADAEGFAAYLHKPIKPSQLFDALVSVLAERPVHVGERGAARSEFDPAMASRHPLRILLAEDNIVNQKVALRLLGQMGYRADVAANGLEVIEAVERQAYDVVLMDVQMPEMDGFEASREINRRWAGGERPRIIAMTANAMQGDRELCVAAGMDDYVAKPIRVEELVTALERSPRRADPGARGTVVPSTTVAPASPDARSGSRHAGDAPGAEDSASRIDRPVIEQLTAAMTGEFVAELIETFIEDGRQLVAALHRALADTDVDSFRRASHSLKSTSEALGATTLAAVARALEALARTGTLAGADEALLRITVEYERAARELGQLRRDLLT